MVDIVVRLDESIVEAAKEVAYEYGVTIEELIAMAIEHYLNPEVEEIPSIDVGVLGWINPSKTYL